MEVKIVSSSFKLLLFYSFYSNCSLKSIILLHRVSALSCMYELTIDRGRPEPDSAPSHTFTAKVAGPSGQQVRHSDTSQLEVLFTSREGTRGEWVRVRMAVLSFERRRGGAFSFEISC